VLRHLPRSEDPNFLIGDNPADDAAVYRLRDDLALVQTVDFFTPIVDDPYTFGQIAAANSLSDVFAMGARPLTALNIAAFPMASLGADVLADILRGGADKAREAGVTIVGGHTVDDTEPKYGLAVTGTVDPRRMMTARGAQPGDVLVLTKPLGTGVIATALKAGAARPADVEQAVRWMTTLNRSASTAMTEADAHAATDITGFGLLGHLADLCMASGVSAHISISSIPLLPGARDYAATGHVPGGTRTNQAYVERYVQAGEDIDGVTADLLSDPQTSGGLLVALEPKNCQAFRGALSNDSLYCPVGRIDGSEDGCSLALAP